MARGIRQSQALGKVTNWPLTGCERFSQGSTERLRERICALTATLLSEADFTAEPIERLDVPEPPTRAERRFHVIALIAAAVLHLLIPLSFFAYYWLWPRTIPTAVQEIPVEVVVEQPQPPPPQPKPPEEKPKPPPRPLDEKPAYDAPADPTEEKVNRESPDKKTEAKATPEAPPPPNPGASPKADAPAPAPHPAEEQKGEAAPPAHDLKPQPDGELPTDQNPKPEDNPTQAAAPAAPPAPPQKAPVGAPLPTFEDLPQYQFARSVEKSPVAGGNAESRYFTIIFGKIKPHLPGRALLDSATKRGTIDFYLDEGGNLIGRKLASSSGSDNLDIAVMAAIAAGAPYPPPPNWSPVGLIYEFGRFQGPPGSDDH
jgi:periplasmic protein TonB